MNNYELIQISFFLGMIGGIFIYAVSAELSKIE